MAMAIIIAMLMAVLSTVVVMIWMMEQKLR